MGALKFVSDDKRRTIMMRQSKTAHRFLASLVLSAALPIMLSACQTLNEIGEPAAAEAETARYPVDPDVAKQSGSSYRTLKNSRGKVLGDLKTGFPFPALFGDDQDRSTEVVQQGKADGTVNTHLWRAALDTVGFMPVQVADVAGGIIQTGWYEDQKRPNERFKVNVFVVSDDLRPDGVRVGVFSEKRESEQEPWRDAGASPEAAEGLRSLIVDRAAELANAT